MDARLLDAAGAAEYLGVTERMVRRLIQERRVPFVRVGRHVRLDRADLDAWIDAHRVDVARAPARGLRVVPGEGTG